MTSYEIVADGFERACTGIEAQVRADVTLEYAERLATASFFQWIALRGEMEAEIERRIAERIVNGRISADALY
jgi:hypothetical protein